MVRLRFLVSVFRTPVILFAGVLLFVFYAALIPNLIMIVSFYMPTQALWQARSAGLDYLLYQPNVVTFLAFLAAAFALLEAKRALIPCNRSIREDAITGVVGLSVAIFPVLLATNINAGCLQLLISGIQVLLLWLFLMFNVGLYVCDRYLRSDRVGRLLDWTFPVSDIVFYMSHRERLGAAVGVVRFVPALSYALIIIVALWVEGRVLSGAIRAERVAVQVSVGSHAVLVDGGFWFSNGDWWDPRSGLWYYDEGSRVAYPYIRVADLRKYFLEDGFFYFHDRYSGHVLKVDAKTRRVVWRVPAKPGFGTFEVVRNDLIFAMGEGGYILVIDRDGAVRAERGFSFYTVNPQALPDGRVAFLSGDTQIRIWNNSLTAGVAIPLPLASGVLTAESGAGKWNTATNWTDYDDRSNTLYVQTLWGEIFRYDVGRDRWLPSVKTRLGLRSIAVDSRNNLLFAGYYFRGYIDVINLESGKRVRSILANALGRFINLDPVKMVGILNTSGRGMYRFEYGDIVRHRGPVDRS